MKGSEAFLLALEIIRLDIKRNELYEELLELSGTNSELILRSVQNGIIFTEKLNAEGL